MCIGAQYYWVPAHMRLILVVVAAVLAGLALYMTGGRQRLTAIAASRGKYDSRCTSLPLSGLRITHAGAIKGETSHGNTC